MAKSDNKERSIRNYNAHFTRTNLFVELANNTQQNLMNTLFLVATIFLGLTSPLVSDVQSLPGSLRLILFLSWILTILSIFSGLIQVIFDMLFLKDSFISSSKREGIWKDIPEEDGEFDTAIEQSNKIAKLHKVQSTFIPLILQAVFISIAMVLAIIVGGGVLFGYRELSPEKCPQYRPSFHTMRTQSKSNFMKDYSCAHNTYYAK